MSRLTWKERERLPKRDFVFPSKAPGPGSYPIPDASHARNALARVRRFGSTREQAAVCQRVARRFPRIHESHCAMHRLRA